MTIVIVANTAIMVPAILSQTVGHTTIKFIANTAKMVPAILSEKQVDMML